MHHGMTDFDARWETIEDDSADFRFENTNEFRIFLKVHGSAVDGCSEMTCQSAR